MKVKSLKFNDFRNLKDNIIYPGEGINVIYGDNAQGKTNLLEAIWLFSGGHSFRGSKESELTKIGSKSSCLQMEFFSQEREQIASIKFSGNKKEIEINSVSRPSSAYLSQCFAAVVFSPEHLSLVKNGPSLRRRFIDGAIYQQNIKFALLLSKYNHTLFQRNALLKEIYKHPELEETLCIWDDYIIALGAKIILERISFINKLNVIAADFHNGISKGKEELFIDYVSSSGINLEDNEEEIINKLRENFIKCKKEDIKLSCTNCGPHRDDLDFFINGMKAKTFGSQGQQRSVVLSLKLAEAQILKEYFGEPPVVLLDDVLSEIDRSRQEFLLDNTRGCQTFITGCEPPLKEGENIKIFTIDKGEVL